MVVHLTARVAWHDDGWNGNICRKPDCNTYCVGNRSYPGDTIAQRRDLVRERANAGRPVADLRDADLPPCIFSVNAFGDRTVTGYADPPSWWRKDEASRTEWEIPSATVCVWPAEVVYGDTAKGPDGRYDNNRRAQNVDEFFALPVPDKSLIFYYANYSNPLSTDELPRYLLVGVSRLKAIGDRLSYDGTTEYVRQRHAGGMIWARNITSHYPEEGFRLPYHKYRSEPDKLARIAISPDDPRTCKWVTRHVTNDEAIGLLEQLLGALQFLHDLGDTSDNWSFRKDWTLNCIGDLWRRRGLYPGLPRVAELIGANEAIRAISAVTDHDKLRQLHSDLFQSIEAKTEASHIYLVGSTLQKVSRTWALLSPDQRVLLRHLLPRLDLGVTQMKRIMEENCRKRAKHGLRFRVRAPVDNPYLLCENYIGDDPSDRIPWGVVDRGIFPSPELGGKSLGDVDTDDARRLRSLCVDELQREPNHVFQAADHVLARVNKRLDVLPGWKSCSFTDRHFDVDHEELEDALVFRSEHERRWVYLRTSYEDEREVEYTLVNLVRRGQLVLKRSVSREDWRAYIEDRESPLFNQDGDRYAKAIESQANACQAIFRQPLAVVTGAAGTGKTTVICAIIQAIRRTEGDGTGIAVMTPTGKASDRVRRKLAEQRIGRVNVSTLHSYLAARGWLNDNLTLRREYGRKAGVSTIIIDEASMLELAVMAVFVRATDWHEVRRLVLVGDPNQLPPIGRGRVFADTIEWLEVKSPASVARLDRNLRQFANEIEHKGTAIPRVADLFIARNLRKGGRATSAEDENLLANLHKGGRIDSDFDVVYWSNPDDLSTCLIDTMERKMVDRTPEVKESDPPKRIWWIAEGESVRYQVLTPHRAGLHGVDALNRIIQERFLRDAIAKWGTSHGITLFDKVMQIRNRGGSYRIRAYNEDSRKAEQVEIYNGEIGYVNPQYGDQGVHFRRNRSMAVRFAHKSKLWVNYNDESEIERNLELAYAVSIHKAQGSEFDHTFVIVPRTEGRILSPELLYTALTRATNHCTLLVEKDIGSLLIARRPENGEMQCVNSSLFDGMFRFVPDPMARREDWYEEGLIHRALTEDMVRSKSELVIANMLCERRVPFKYEMPLYAPDGTMYLPDFTITWNGETWYWEHWGRLESDRYRKHMALKHEWYNEHFPGRLVETVESGELSQDANALIKEKFS